MKQWGRWGQYYKEGGGGSWPRDAFESVIDYYEEKIVELTEEIKRLKGKADE